MDLNKAKKVVEIPLVEAKCCGTCGFWTRGTKDDGFGTCFVHSYRHRKHGDMRELSTHEYNFCNDECYRCALKYNSGRMYVLYAGGALLDSEEQ